MASKRNDAGLVTAFMQLVSLGALLAMLVAWPADTRRVEDLLWAGAGGVSVAIGLTAFYTALARGPIATAAALTGLVSAAVPIVAGLALGDTMSALAMVGIVLSVPAVVMVSAEADELHGTSVASPRERIAGRAALGPTRLLAVLAGLGFGLFFVALSRTSVDAGLFPLVGARLASVALLSMFLTARRAWAPLAPSSWPVVIVAGILDCAANALYLSALGNGTFTWIAAITSLYPVATVVLARIVLREHLAPVQVAGLVLAGSALTLIAVGR
jgi:drug/metabolite transporter (DMT)-like permease